MAVISRLPQSGGGKCVSWEHGEWEDIAAMLEKHYNGEIDISDYWSVGNARKVTMSAIASAYGLEAQSEQELELVIMDFSKISLTSAIGDRTKSAMVVGLRSCLSTMGYVVTTQGQTWGESARLNWCNDSFKGALPQELSNLVKQVTISYGTYTTKSSLDCYCFLHNAGEVFGSGASTNVSYSSDDQLEYYKCVSNRVKTLYGTDDSLSVWALRDLYGTNTTYSYFTAVYKTGGVTYNSGSAGISPAFCL